MRQYSDKRVLLPWYSVVILAVCFWQRGRIKPNEISFSPGQPSCEISVTISREQCQKNATQKTPSPPPLPRLMLKT
jgi:hypothetical protein